MTFKRFYEIRNFPTIIGVGNLLQNSWVFVIAFMAFGNASPTHVRCESAVGEIEGEYSTNYSYCKNIFKSELPP